MIFGGRAAEDWYTPWFAWRMVRLNGPYEWDRMRLRNCRARWTWLRTIVRWRHPRRTGTYYALPEEML